MSEVLPLTSNTFSNFGRVQNWSSCYITFDPIKHSHHYTCPLEVQNTRCCFMQLVTGGMKQLKFPHKVYVKCSNPTEATNLKDSDRHQPINNGFHLAKLHFVKRQCTLRRPERYSWRWPFKVDIEMLTMKNPQELTKVIEMFLPRLSHANNDKLANKGTKQLSHHAQCIYKIEWHN